MKIRNFLVLALPLLLASTFASAQSCPPSGNLQGCAIPIPGRIKCDPGLLAYQSSEHAPICVTSNNAAVPVMADCSSFGGGMSCEGWSQEVSEPQQYFRYSWSVRVGMVVTQYNTGGYPYLNFSCNTGQPVRVTMTLRNGTWTGTSTQNYTCGDQNQ